MALARLPHCAASMTLACDFRRPVDPPHVIDRVRENLPLVDIICEQIRRQLGRALRLEDLVSYGYEGLLVAARTFDESRGVPFRRWANIRVRGAVIDGIRTTSTLPRSVYERLRAADSDAPVSSHEGWAGGEVTDGASNAEDALARAEILGMIHKCIRELPGAQRALLQRHYFDDVTVDQAAVELGLSKSWASRLHGRAVERVRRSLKNARRTNLEKSARDCAHGAPHDDRTRNLDAYREERTDMPVASPSLTLAGPRDLAANVGKDVTMGRLRDSPTISGSQEGRQQDLESRGERSRATTVAASLEKFVHDCANGVLCDSGLAVDPRRPAPSPALDFGGKTPEIESVRDAYDLVTRAELINPLEPVANPAADSGRVEHVVPSQLTCTTVGSEPIDKRRRARPLCVPLAVNIPSCCGTPIDVGSLAALGADTDVRRRGDHASGAIVECSEHSRSRWRRRWKSALPIHRLLRHRDPRAGPTSSARASALALILALDQ